MHFTLGLALIEIEQFEKAAGNFTQCLAARSQPALTPVNPAILKGAPHHCLALCLSKLERPVPAEAAFRAALEAEPLSRGPRFDYAYWLSKKGRPVESLELLHKLCAENPADLEAWHLGGHIALSISRPDFLEFADDWTREAVKSLPQNQMILAQREEVLRRRQAAVPPGPVPA
jgi:tetratricopeptide (TPR) repeat protein